MKKTICQICKNPNLTELNGIEGYHYCNSCKVAWMKKFPKVEYEGEYYKGKSSIAGKLFNPLAAFLYSIRESYNKGSNHKIWIDVGAGEGGFLNTVNAKRKIGVEVSKIGRELMTKSGIEALKDTEFLKKKSLNADVISFWHVLEHLEQPWEYLESAKKNLSKKGEIIIGVPNIDSLEFKFFKKHWFHLAPEYHLWQFSPKSMQKMLENEGFRIKSIDYWSPEHHLAGLLQSFINKSSDSDAVLHKLIKRRLQNERLSTRGLVWSLFWLTLGLLIVFFVWIFSSLIKRSGTFVVIAKQVS